MNCLNIAILIVPVLGLPGNLLCIAVYVRKMTTSTIVYMFALAVGDSSVYFCGIFVCFTRHFITRFITFCIFDVSVRGQISTLVQHESKASEDRPTHHISGRSCVLNNGEFGSTN